MDRATLIQSYLFEKLSDSEQKEFTKLLQSDLDFKREVAFQKDLFLAMQEVENNKLKQELKALDKPNVKRIILRWIVAASILFLFGTIFTTLKKQQPADFFIANFKPYQNVMHPVVRGDMDVSNVEKAFMYYENGDYTKFIESMESIKKTNIDYNFYIANAYLATNQTKEAILVLTDYLQQPAIKYRNKANWYLALAYVKNKDIKTAKKYLREIVLSKSYNFKKAEPLLKQL